MIILKRVLAIAAALRTAGDNLLREGTIGMRTDRTMPDMFRREARFFARRLSGEDPQ